MQRKTIMAILAVAAVCMFGTPAFSAKGKPNFGTAIYADGQVFGTKATTVLPAPNEYNLQSFDPLYVITNSNNPEGQLPVGEAAPGSPDYNGGRWFTHTVEWTQEAFMEYGHVPVLFSYSDIMIQKDMGYVIVTPGSFPGGPPVYFQCPLLPVKEWSIE